MGSCYWPQHSPCFIYLLYKIMDIFIEKVCHILYETEHSQWVVRSWHYWMSKEVFKLWLKHFLNTWEDVLTEFDKLVYLSRDSHSDYDYSIEDIETFEMWDIGFSFWSSHKIYNEDEYAEIKYKIESTKNKLARLKEYKQRRKKATQYTTYKRQNLLKKLWEICLYCSSETNLTIDHIIPVLHWWDEDIKNLQVLCRSCNSKKWSKVLHPKK